MALAAERNTGGLIGLFAKKDMVDVQFRIAGAFLDLADGATVAVPSANVGLEIVVEFGRIIALLINRRRYLSFQGKVDAHAPLPSTHP